MGLTLGLAAALSWALCDLWAVRITRAAPTSIALAWLLAAGLAATLPFAVYAEGLARWDAWPSIGFAALAGILYPFAFGCFLRGLRTGSLSVVAPLTALEGGFAAAFAIALGERVSLLVAVGLLAAASGAVLAAAERGRRSAAGASWALLAAIAFAMIFILYSHSDELAPASVVAVSRAVSLLVLVPCLLGRSDRLAPALRPVAAGAGALDAIGFTALAGALAIGPVAVASVAAAQFATVAACLGVIFLRERLTTHQYIGIAITLAGVSVLALAG